MHRKTFYESFGDCSPSGFVSLVFLRVFFFESDRLRRLGSLDLSFDEEDDEVVECFSEDFLSLSLSLSRLDVFEWIRFLSLLASSALLSFAGSVSAGAEGAAETVVELSGSVASGLGSGAGASRGEPWLRDD